MNLIMKMQQTTRHTGKQFFGKHKSVWKEVPPRCQRRTHNVYHGSPGSIEPAKHVHALLALLLSRTTVC